MNFIESQNLSGKPSLGNSLTLPCNFLIFLWPFPCHFLSLTLPLSDPFSATFRPFPTFWPFPCLPLYDLLLTLPLSFSYPSLVTFSPLPCHFLTFPCHFLTLPLPLSHPFLVTFSPFPATFSTCHFLTLSLSPPSPATFWTVSIDVGWYSLVTWYARYCSFELATSRREMSINRNRYQLNWAEESSFVRE